ncbi:MAG: 3-phosphoshikimate 1-carboxyvinyltransferase [Alphaproteobacteria bacterium]
MPTASVQTAHPATTGLRGIIAVPGDKSISHRALILGALCIGESTIHGLLEGADVLATAQALRAYGADIQRDGRDGRDGKTVWRVNGLGVGGLLPPQDILDLGNSGTGARLLLGLAAGHGLTSIFTGDASLRRRPMQRVITPLAEMGGRFEAAPGGRLPITVVGRDTLMPIEYRLPVASAQIKSAVLLAGLNAPGRTSVIEPRPTRDHTEHLLRHFGAEVSVEDDGEDGRRISLTGRPELRPQTVRVPGDPSSAAFPIAAALLVPGSEVTIRGVGLNPLRAALLETLRDMGAVIEESNAGQYQGEPIADLLVRAGPLHGIEVPPGRAPAMIDEYPILAAIAAFATGKTVMRGIAELRLKESDRIAAMARGLDALGVAVEELEDGLIVHGRGGPAPAPPGVRIETEMDHRVAMSFLVYGLGAQASVTVLGCEMIETSFPGFADLINGLGAHIEDIE